MIARVLTAQVRHDQLMEIGRLYQEVLRPLPHQLTGFEGAWLLLNSQSGQSTAIMIWSNKACLQAGEASQLFQAQLDQLTPAFTGTPSQVVLDVLMQLSGR